MDNYTIQRLYKNGIEKISRSVRAYVYLVLTSQVQARSSIALINEDYSIGINIERYQGV